MKFFRRLAITIPAVLLVLCLAATWWTRGAMTHLAFLRAQRTGKGTSGNLVDQRPWQTIESLAPLAVSAEEQSLAHEAERLSDHAVDQAFSFALRQASLRSHTLTGDALAVQQKVAQLQAMVKEDQAHVDALTASLKQPNGTIADSDDLDLAKAQLQLGTDELNDPNEKLPRASGDQRGQIQDELTAHEAAMKKYDSQAAGGQIAIISSTRRGTLYGRVSSWFDQRSRMDLIKQAKAQTDADVAALTAKHDKFEKQATAAESAAGSSAQPNTAAPVPDVARSKMARMSQAHALAQMHNIVEDQLATQKQLSAVYTKWLAQAQLQHGIVGHLALQSLS